ncbi:MAG: KH domain-containing protein [archaeon]
MKTVICETDLKSKSLCSDCQEKLSNNKITDLDVRISRYLYDLTKQNYNSKSEFLSSIDLNDYTLIICKGNIGSLIGKAGRNVREMSKKLNKKVRFIELSHDSRKTIQDLVGNASVLAVNQLFENNEKVLKVMISGSEQSKLIGSREELEKAIEKLFNVKVVLLFAD